MAAPAVSDTGFVFKRGSMAESTVYKPAILHQQHPDSRLGQDFHWVPYPLGLMPYDSWHHLHHRENIQPSLPFRCPVCRQARKATAHMRKLFLVAERLTWEEGLVSIQEKELNEELNWKCNYELGILDPFVEDQEHASGGKNSQINIFHPYQNEHELRLALTFMFMAADITETSWALWIAMQLDLETVLSEHEVPEAVQAASRSLPEEREPPQRRRSLARQKTAEVELIDLTGLADRASQPALEPLGLLTPSSSSSERHLEGERNATSLDGSKRHRDNPSFSKSRVVSTSVEPSTRSHHSKRIMSYKTLQDFYSLLDRIERTSYVGALFLEAYAEKLRDDTCQNCWFNHNVKLDVF
ncbi:Nn.00g047750.m01.CDS01 [Neocucurbitaria sp. VM-36]